jgi:hypothetical protein
LSSAAVVFAAEYPAWGAALQASLSSGAEAWPAEAKARADILRCIFENPFRPATLSPAWQTPQVLTLAQAAYEQRELPAGTLDTVRLAVLADALEEAGCDQADLVAHLRGAGPHVRGCWAVDLLLGKE